MSQKRNSLWQKMNGLGWAFGTFLQGIGPKAPNLTSRKQIRKKPYWPPRLYALDAAGVLARLIRLVTASAAEAPRLPKRTRGATNAPCEQA